MGDIPFSHLFSCLCTRLVTQHGVHPRWEVDACVHCVRWPPPWCSCWYEVSDFSSSVRSVPVWQCLFQYKVCAFPPGVRSVPYPQCLFKLKGGIYLVSSFDVPGWLHLAFEANIVSTDPRNVITFFCVLFSGRVYSYDLYFPSILILIMLWESFQPFCAQYSEPESMFGLHLCWNGRVGWMRGYCQHTVTSRRAFNDSSWETAVIAWWA